MPSTWNAQELLDELVDSTLLEQRPVDGRYVFGKRGYQDFFAAVHIDAEGLNSIAAQQIIADQQSEHWLPIMINLIGILPQPDMLLKVLCERDASLATQLWFENRPDKVAVPESIVSSFERQEKAAVDSRVMQLIEPYSHAVLKRLLKSADPRQRLQATCALTQHGLPATEALLDAAEDDHPLVQVVAQYALIHLGVGAYPKDPHRPMPPLLNVEDDRFVFNSHGGCNARVGPLRLVDVPNPATVHLSLVMEHLDFDLFEAEVTYKLEHTPPSLLAAYLFEAMKSMDWMCLTVHCRWIARQSAALARKAESL